MKLGIAPRETGCTWMNLQTLRGFIFHQTWLITLILFEKVKNTQIFGAELYAFVKVMFMIKTDLTKDRLITCNSALS